MKKMLLLLVGMIILSLTIAPNIVSSSKSTIVITGADAQAIHNFSGSTTLNSLLAAIPDHFIFAYADLNKKISFTTPPNALLTLVESIGDRFVIQYGDRNALIGLGYPKELIGDTSPPSVSSLAADPLGNDQYQISLDTSEYSICACNFGTSPGNYSQSLTEDLYNYHHEYVLSNLQVDTYVYYRVSCTDRSDNITQTQEYSFLVVDKSYLFLPLIIK